MIAWLSPADPPNAFPPVARAQGEPSGLVAVGGDLSTARLLAAYARGIFPWFSPGEPILWWSPDPREVLFPARLHCSRSLRALLRRAPFAWRSDTAFDAVVAACAAPRQRSAGTWITAPMQQAYAQLHRLGHAHSYECWQDDTLVGGLYGVRVGGVFCGESMFSAADNASKFVLARLAEACPQLGIELIDCQLPNAHLRSLGSEPMPRSEFLSRLPPLTGAALHC